MNIYIKAKVDGEHFGTINVDQWTHNKKNDCVYVGIAIRNGSASLYMTKNQARELAQALMQIVEA